MEENILLKMENGKWNKGQEKNHFRESIKTSPRKILFRLRSMEMGGTQKVMLDLMNRLDRQKYTLYLLLDLNQGILIKEIPDHVQVYYIGMDKEKLSAFLPKKIFLLICRRILLSLYHYFPFLLRRKLGFVPDVEIAFMDSALPGLLNSPFKESRKISWFHSDVRFFRRRRMIKVVKMMNKCIANVFVSNGTLENTVQYSGMPITNGLCIYNAFDYKQIQLKAGLLPKMELKSLEKELKTFVSVGRLGFQKGYDVLLEAHADLIKEGLKHRIVIIGSGNAYKKLQKMIDLKGVSETFLLLGEKANPYSYIAWGDFYIQPSRYEAYPLAVGEALILNKPVLCTDVGGIREMVSHGKTGFIVDFSKESLKNGITTFLNCPRLTAHIKEEQRKLDFEEHNKQVCRKVEMLLEKIMTHGELNLSGI